eukprot:gene13922-18671_t
MNFLFFDIIVWVIIPLFNFLLFYHLSSTQSLNKSVIDCSDIDQLSTLLTDSLKELELDQLCDEKQTSVCLPRIDYSKGKMSISFVDTMEFDKYRNKNLGSLQYPENILPDDTDTAILQLTETERSEKIGTSQCQSIHHHFSGIKYDDNCFGVIHFDDSDHISKSFNAMLRFNSDIDAYGVSISHPDKPYLDKYSGRDKKGKLKYVLNAHNINHPNPTGFFRKVAKDNSRIRLNQKLGLFLEYFQDIEYQLVEKLNEHKIKRGDDVIVMVVNEGEIDLFLNFACSCRIHSIKLSNVIVFAGSREILMLIEATGAMALFNEAYASVSKKASNDYLDRVFVDMMWFKAFSVFLLIRQGINILFQDVDLVWFRDPLDYFHEKQWKIDNNEINNNNNSQIEAFFSDDGQRSMRYTPIYANSGFYYLVANNRTEFYTWSIMKAFDAVHVLGSHQNVFTTKLLEGLALGINQAKILSLSDFPNGILYHHDNGYMQEFKTGKVHPYGFHMCWTQGKPDKLIYLKKSSMWYLTPHCSPLEALIADNIVKGEKKGEKKSLGPGPIYDFLKEISEESAFDQWEKLGEKCCTSMPNAP